MPAASTNSATSCCLPKKVPASAWRVRYLYEETLECIKTQALTVDEMAHLLDWGWRVVYAGPPSTCGRGIDDDEFVDRVPYTEVVVSFVVDLDGREVVITDISRL